MTPEGFLGLVVPVPELADQDALVAIYAAALDRATKLEREAQAIEDAGLRAFEAALGVAAPPVLPDRPVFVARFKDIERWSHEGILRATSQPHTVSGAWPTIALGDALLEVKHGCSIGPTRSATTLRVLKISAVTKGRLAISEHKYIVDKQ